MSKKYYKSDVSDPPLVMEVSEAGTHIKRWAKDAGWEEISKEDYDKLVKQHKMEDIADVGYSREFSAEELGDTDNGKC